MVQRDHRLMLRNLPFARAIRELRYGLGLHQEAFAEELGCSVAALSAWENGQTTPSRLAERALRDVAMEHGWQLDVATGIATDPLYRRTKGIA